MELDLIFFTLALGTLAISMTVAVRTTRLAVTPTEGRTCVLNPLLDRVLDYGWPPSKHRHVAALLRRYGHRTHADLHEDVAARLLVEQRLEAERRAWASAHPAVRELRPKRVMV